MKNIDMCRCLLGVPALFLAVSLMAGETAKSTPCVIYGNPQASVQWRTVMSDSLSLALDWPAGAASAALTVAKGMDRDTAEVTDTTATALPLEIVFPTEEKSEGVLELTLVYKDAQGEALDTQTARLGLVRGVGAATARCILDASVRQWSVVKGSAVMPIPEGTTELSVNANSVGPLDAPGWWLWQIEENGDYTFSLTASGETREVQLVGKKTGGLILLVR